MPRASTTVSNEHCTTLRAAGSALPFAQHKMAMIAAPASFIVQGFGNMETRSTDEVPANWRDGIPSGDERLRGGPFHRDPRPRVYGKPRADFTPSPQVKGGPPAYAHLMGNPCEWSLMSCDRGPSQASKGFRSPVGWQRGLHPDLADKLYDASLVNNQAVYERFAKNVRDLFKDGAPQCTALV